MTAEGKRVETGTITVIDKICSYCGHNRAWSKPRGTFCTKCGREL